MSLSYRNQSVDLLLLTSFYMIGALVKCLAGLGCTSRSGSSFYIGDIGHVFALVYKDLRTFQVFLTG